MSPILGIMASAISGNLVTNSYESIATVTVGAGGSATVTFSSIPSTFKHLQIRYTGRANISSNYAQSVFIKLNGDTGSNYARHALAAYTGGYSATTAIADINQTRMDMFGGLSSANWTSQMQGAGIIDILDYQNTNKFKTVRSLAGAEGNDSSTLISILGLSSGLWRSTSAITSIELSSNADFVQNSKFALYGIKG